MKDMDTSLTLDEFISNFINTHISSNYHAFLRGLPLDREHFFHFYENVIGLSLIGIPGKIRKEKGESLRAYLFEYTFDK